MYPLKYVSIKMVSIKASNIFWEMQNFYFISKTCRLDKDLQVKHTMELAIEKVLVV